MIQRTDIYKLKGELKEIEIDLSGVIRQLDSFFTYFRASENKISTIQKIEMIEKAEKIVKEVVQKIIAKINPDTNSLIDFNDKKNENYKWLVIHLGIVMERLEKKRQEIINKLSNLENIDTNKITNKINLISYESYIYNILSDLVYNPLNEALIKYNSIKVPAIKSKKGKKEIPKNESFFWFLVFSYFFRSSQIIGSVVGMKDPIPRTFNVSDLKKMFKVAPQQVQTNQTSENPPEENSEESKKDEEGEGDEEDES